MNTYYSFLALILETHVLNQSFDRCWLQTHEEIMVDTATCAMAFRILRMNGYDVSSGVFLDLENFDTFKF